MNQENIEPFSEAELDEAHLAVKEILDPLNDDEREKLNAVLSALLNFAVSKGQDPMRATGRAVIGLAWLVMPELLGGRSVSAIAQDLGCTKAALSAYVARASRAFGIRCRGQCHAWNFRPSPKRP